ncbi:MAG: hypothetical protein GX131_08520 [candidate division WS1 bacterium]|jgi:hypothetical protein|nr:hypothetical protein [candidate division WS1 bacterium]
MPSSTTRELRSGCRRGNVSALDALLYHCADGVYAVALAAVEDEEQAQQTVRQVWLRLLKALKSLRFDADPARRLWRITERVVAEQVGREAARRARLSVTGEDGSVGLEGVRLPREVIEELSELTHGEAEAIRNRYRARRNAFRGFLASLLLTTVGVWVAVFMQRARVTEDIAQLKYECLRERIIRQELPAAIREVGFQLDYATEADREMAADCERVQLVLEEIANAQSLRQVNYLRYIRQRVTRHELADFVRSLEETFPEMSDTLPRVALALEEVESL